MVDDPAALLREQAREWGRALLLAPAWEPASDRVTLLVLSPPTGIETGEDGGRSLLWLTIDAQTARSLLPPLARALAQGEAVVEHHRARGTAEATTLAITTDEAAHRLLQGVTRRSAEARWQVRHAEAVSDRLHRLEQYHVRATMLPEDGLERMIRPLWVDVVQVVRALDASVTEQPPDLLPAAGEAVADLCRIACAVDDGAYPPVEYLRRVARDTRIGRRLDSWLDDFHAAVGGDAAAARRVLGSREQALHEATQVLAERFRNRPWLNDPEAFALRAPR